MIHLLARSWPLLLAVAILLATPVLLAQNRYGRAALEVSAYLPTLVLLPDPIRPMKLFTEAPDRRRVEIEYQSREGPRSMDADLYLPASGSSLGAAIFSMGTPPLELDDPRLVRIAEDASRAGIVMLVPFSERLDDLEIKPEEIDALVAQFEYARALPRVDPARVGFIGVSVGASLAIVAAADERIAGDVAYLVSFGGYFDALDTLKAVMTRRIEYGEVSEEWEPRSHAEEVMGRQVIDRLESETDRRLLFRALIWNDPIPEDELAELTPAGRAAYDLLVNRDPETIDELIDRLPEETIAELEFLSPAAAIDRVETGLFIIHDRADPLIPFTESRKMVDALGDGPRIRYEEIRLFEHVDPQLNQRPDIITLDTSRLLFRLYQLLLLLKGHSSQVLPS